MNSHEYSCPIVLSSKVRLNATNNIPYYSTNHVIFSLLKFINNVFQTQGFHYDAKKLLLTNGHGWGSKFAIQVGTSERHK